MRRDEVIPIVLAAGASSRMGQPKEWLKFGEVSCLDLALAACVGAGVGRPIVVTRNERKGTLESHLAGNCMGATIAINARPELGQTSSLCAGLQILPREARAFLIYPVDYPLVRASDIERLCESYVKEWPSGLIVTPSYARRRGHPVLVDATLSPSLLALTPGASAREVLAKFSEKTVYVECEDDRLLMDMDTPEDYERCLARFRLTAEIRG